MLKEKHLDVKYKKPLTKKALREACKNPMAQTKLKLRKGFENAPIFYFVPMHVQLSDADKKLVVKGLVTSTIPDKAKELVMKQPGWMYRDISLVKDFECGVLMYKGLAVALYYKRQVSKIEPEPYDPVPTGVLENPEDIWARLDLFSKSPRQLVADVKEELYEKDQLILDLQQQLSASKVLLTTVESIKLQKYPEKLAEIQKQLATANSQIAKLEAKLKPGKVAKVTELKPKQNSLRRIK